MRASLLTLLLVVVALVPNQQVVAQSPEMPEPLAIVVDADGKPMVQVISITSNETTSTVMVGVLFDFDGELDFFNVDLELGHFDNGPSQVVFFSGDNCTGDLFVNGPQQVHAALQLQTRHVIDGPDSGSGVYRVFRTTGQPPVSVLIESRWNIALSVCEDTSPTQLEKNPAEEILPNPLEGFHGPTTANPDRVLAVRGGTRLP